MSKHSGAAICGPPGNHRGFGSCLFPQQIQSKEDSPGSWRAIPSGCASHDRSPGLDGLGAPQEASEAKVSAFSVLVMLNAIVFVYDQSMTWWRESAWRKVARRWSSLDP